MAERFGRAAALRAGRGSAAGTGGAWRRRSDYGLTVRSPNTLPGAIPAIEGSVLRQTDTGSRDHLVHIGRGAWPLVHHRCHPFTETRRPVISTRKGQMRARNVLAVGIRWRAWSSGSPRCDRARSEPVQLGHGLLKVGRRWAGIPGRRRKACVACQGGHAVQGDALVHEPFGEGMPERVRRHGQLQAGATHVACKCLLGGARCQWVRTRAAWEHGGVLCGCLVWPTRLAPGLQRPTGGERQGHLPIPCTLSLSHDHDAAPLPDGEIGPAQRQGLGDAQPGLTSKVIRATSRALPALCASRSKAERVRPSTDRGPGRSAATGRTWAAGLAVTSPSPAAHVNAALTTASRRFVVAGFHRRCSHDRYSATSRLVIAIGSGAAPVLSSYQAPNALRSAR